MRLGSSLRPFESLEVRLSRPASPFSTAGARCFPSTSLALRNFFPQLRHKTNLTSALLLLPPSTYENGTSNSSSRVLTSGSEDSGSGSSASGGGVWYSHLKDPQVRCPVPANTSVSVLQRSPIYR